MPKGHNRSITFPEDTADRIQYFCRFYDMTLTKILELQFKESQHLKTLANKITTVPDTVRVYT